MTGSTISFIKEAMIIKLVESYVLNIKMVR